MTLKIKLHAAFRKSSRGRPARLLRVGKWTLPALPHGPAALTGVPAVTLVADFPQAVEALIDAPQPVLQLHVPGTQHLRLHAAHVLRADGVLLDLCGASRGLRRKDLCPRVWGHQAPSWPLQGADAGTRGSPSVQTVRVGKHRLGGGVPSPNNGAIRDHTSQNYTSVGGGPWLGKR